MCDVRIAWGVVHALLLNWRICVLIQAVVSKEAYQLSEHYHGHFGFQVFNIPDSPCYSDLAVIRVHANKNGIWSNSNS